MEKSQKKKKRKFFKTTFSLAVFLFPVMKRGKKVSGFIFSVRGEGKFEIDYKKKEIFFSPFGRFFDHFLVATLPEKMIRKWFGGKEKE